MSVLCVCPVRGGSKNIPKKNLAPLAGVPLVVHALRAAKGASLIDSLVVSTDDDEIADVCRGEGVEIIERPPELATDSAPTLPVIQHAVWIMEKHGFRPDYIMTLQATYPFVTTENIEALIRAIESHDTDSATTLFPAPYRYHPFNARHMNPDGTASFAFAEEKLKFPNRQAAPEFYFFGNLLISTYKTLMEDRVLYGDRTTPVIVTALESFDIDDRDDLEMAEFLMTRRRQGETRAVPQT